MNGLDLLLILVTLGYGLTGYWQGFVTGALATVGLLSGGGLGIVVLPTLLERLRPSVAVAMAALFGVLLLGALGQALGSYAGARMRRRITWRPARSLDAVGGAALSMAAALVVAWALGYAASGARLPVLADAVRASTVLARVDRVMPDGAEGVLGQFNRIVDRSLFPRYLEPFAPEHIVAVDAPNRRVLARPAVHRAAGSVVKVLGESAACGRGVEGSGFAYAPERVMTNAHVVAGIPNPVVVLGSHSYDAVVVEYDPDLDVAVLAVDGLPAAPLRLDDSARTAASAAVLGYPENGPFSAVPARVRDVQRLSSPDIYDQGSVTREVLSLRADIRSGNSGGPLVSPRGEVYGVVFAASLSDPSTGYALSAGQVAADAAAGRSAVDPVPTGSCA